MYKYRTTYKEQVKREGVYYSIVEIIQYINKCITDLNMVNILILNKKINEIRYK